MFHLISRAAIAVVVLLPFAASAQTPAAAADSMVELRGSTVKYGPLDVPGFPTGLQIGVLNGDPGKPAPYTIRLKFPAGYAFPPHWHPMTENVTVLSGRFFLGIGEKANASTIKSYSAGDYLAIPARHPHFGRVEGETVIQLHGTGPFDIKLVEPIAGASR